MTKRVIRRAFGWCARCGAGEMLNLLTADVWLCDDCAARVLCEDCLQRVRWLGQKEGMSNATAS